MSTIYEKMTAVADAIRGKTGGTEQLTLDDMAVEIAGISTGVELNFDVVGGTTEPENPTENMIWVNTNVEITGWTLSPVLPSQTDGYKDGEIFIFVGTSSNVEFDVLKNNSIQIYPISVVQYISGSFISKAAYIFQADMWKHLWDGTIYNEGNEHTEFTGGFMVDGIEPYTGVEKVPSMSKGTSSISFSISSNGTPTAGRGRTINAINLTTYKTLYAKFNRSISGRWGQCGIAVYDAETNSRVASSISQTAGNNQEVNIDISSINKPCYIGAAMIAHSASDNGNPNPSSSSITIHTMKLLN